MANKTSNNTVFKSEDKTSASERRDKMVFADLEKERAATDAKTARLKALRLEKEAADAAEKLANPPPAKKARVKKAAPAE